MPKITLCTNCQPLKIAMVDLSQAKDGTGYLCPLCSCGMECPAQRVAQYGGHGGGGSTQWAPGGSPMGQGSGGGQGINSNYVDEGFEAIISRTHKNAPIDEKRNIEKRLEPQHAYSEEDEIPYNLSLEERKKLRIKKNIWRREHFIEETKRSIDENSPAFIKEHFFASPTQMRTIEQSLESRHLEPKNRDPREDESPPQDRPTRIHTVATQNSFARAAALLGAIALTTIRESNDLMHGTGRMKGTQDDGSEYDTMSTENVRKHQVPMGQSPLLTTGSDVEQFLDKENNTQFGGSLDNRGGQQGDMLNQITLQDYPQMDQAGPHEAPPAPIIPSSLPSSQVVNDPGIGMEAKIRTLHKQKPKRLIDPYSEVNQDKFEGDEPRGLADTYQTTGIPEPGGVAHA